MRLLIDIGNTSATFGVRRPNKKFSLWRIKTENLYRRAIITREILQGLRKNRVDPEKIEAVIICSVVPKATVKLKKICRIIFSKTEIFVLGKNLKIPIKNKYKIPHQVGVDRLVNVLAVKNEHKLPALVVDFGTAITIDVISKRGEYLGGVIVPGLNMSLKALHDHTALLPLLRPEKPRLVLGRTTKHSILSGVFFGYSYLVDGLIAALGENKRRLPFVVATGGNLNLMKPLCKNISIFDPVLTLKGIEIAYNTAKKNEK